MSLTQDDPISLYKMYRSLQEENKKLKAEIKILQSLIESWTQRFEKILIEHNTHAVKSEKRMVNSPMRE